MTVKKFENERWIKNDQELVFRHKSALELIGGGDVLDLGCGDGLFLRELEKRGVAAQGIDIAEEAVNKCGLYGLHAEVFDFTGEALPFKDNSFDNVVILDVLEHLYCPEELLKEAVRVSRKNIILSVPNFNSLPARSQVFQGKIPENNTAKKGHVFWFNYFVLKSMIEKCGLRIEEMKVNVFWRQYPVIGALIVGLAKIFPNVFGLSFVAKLSKQ